MLNGTVKWFNATKGYGFIQPDDGAKDVFVHITALEEANIRTLQEGDKVQFDTTTNKNGQLYAVNLSKAE